MADNPEAFDDPSAGDTDEDGASDISTRVRRLSGRFGVCEDVSGEWRWRLRHWNGNIIADSGQGYSARTDACEGVDSVRANAPNASVVLVEGEGEES